MAWLPAINTFAEVVWRSLRIPEVCNVMGPQAGVAPLTAVDEPTLTDDDVYELLRSKHLRMAPRQSLYRKTGERR
jgi:hypothetical protein